MSIKHDIFGTVRKCLLEPFKRDCLTDCIKFRKCGEDDASWLTLQATPRSLVPFATGGQAVSETYFVRDFDIALDEPVKDSAGADFGIFGDLFDCDDIECGDQVCYSGKLYQIIDPLGGNPVRPLGHSKCAIRLTTRCCGDYP